MRRPGPGVWHLPAERRGRLGHQRIPEECREGARGQAPALEASRATACSARQRGGPAAGLAARSGGDGLGRLAAMGRGRRTGSERPDRNDGALPQRAGAWFLRLRSERRHRFDSVSSFFFFSIYSVNIMSHQQSLINREVLNKYRNYSRICIENVLRATSTNWLNLVANFTL